MAYILKLFKSVMSPLVFLLFSLVIAGGVGLSISSILIWGLVVAMPGTFSNSTEQNFAMWVLTAIIGVCILVWLANYKEAGR